MRNAALRSVHGLLWIALLACPWSSVMAQGLVLDGATVHTLTGPPQVTSVWIEDGLIRAVGDDLEIPQGTQRIDLSGKFVYPGLFDAFSQMGLIEVSAVSATVDRAEVGSFNPQLTALSAVHPASELIPVTRANGLTQVLTAPTVQQGGILAGQAAVIHLDGWTVEEMAIDGAVAMVIQWPPVQTRSFDLATFMVKETPFAEAKKKAEGAQDLLRDWMDAARHYRQAMESGSERLERNLELEALAGVLEGKQKVILLANSKRNIEGAVAFAEEQGLDMILAGGRDAWMVKDLLAEKQIPVILGLTESLPNEDDEPYDQPFRQPGILHEAGVEIAFGSSLGRGGGPAGPHGARSIPYQAGMGISYGLPADEALRSVTVNPARMLGLDDRLGTLEAGKLANLIVTDGDPLEITTQILHLFIGGEEVSLDNKHLREYERYRARPRAEQPRTETESD